MDVEYTRTTYVARVVWISLFLLALGYEFMPLPKGHKDTLSDLVWDTIRWTHWKFVFFPFWTWVTFHWWVRTEQTIDYRDLVAILIGVVWAILDHLYVRKS
jgi:hypothetical protein